MSDFYLMFFNFNLLQSARRKHWCLPTLAMNFGEEVDVAAFSLILMQKTSLCKWQHIRQCLFIILNQNGHEQMLSFFLKKVFLLKKLEKKILQFYRHLQFTFRAKSSGWTLSHL